MAIWNVICYFTAASTGDASDFGDSSTAAQQGSVGQCNSSTRGVYNNGTTSAGTQTNTIEYVTMGSTGNATDFGDATGIHAVGACMSNATVGFFCGGGNPNIDKITIASTGNATDFGDVIGGNSEQYYGGGMSGLANATRAVMQSGYAGSGYTQGYDYFTISSGGNTSSFGEPRVRGTLTDNAWGYCAGNETLGLWYGGEHAIPTEQIQKITIASTGNGAAYATLGRSYNDPPLNVDSSTSVDPINRYGGATCNGSIGARG